MTRYRIYLTTIVLLLIGLACAVPGISLSEDAFNTAVAQTVMAGLTKNYVSPTFTLTPTLTFTPTLTPSFTLSPTITNTFVVSATPTFPFTPTSTHTSIIPPPSLSVSVNTNCRIGPGKDYAVKSTLLVDDIVQVYGIDPTGRYWYVNNPDLGIEYCWLSSKYATVTGAISLLPVLTPQPTATATATLTPVPDFTVYYKKIETCGPWWVDFELRNNGKVTFKSIRIDIKNPYTNGTLTSGSNDFKNLDGCNTIGTTVDVLNPTEVVTVSSPSMKKSPAGIKLIATITVCTEEDGVGICLTKTLTFKPKL